MQTPSVIDALHIDAIVSASSSRARFTSRVGAGSSKQCLAGEMLIIFVISAVVTIFILDRALHGRSLMTGGGALAVAKNHVHFGFEVDGEVIGRVI